jgi:predicted XRE-type DNA-binding protein
MRAVTIEGRSGKRLLVNQVREDYPVQWYGRKVVTVPMYDSSFYKWVEDALTSRTEDGHDNIVLVTGPRRGGKSTWTGQAALTYDPTFGIGDVAFPLSEFNKILARLPRADAKNGIKPQAWLDEAGWDLYSGNWMTRVSKNMVRKFEVIGEKGITVWLVLPHRMKLLKGIREDMGAYWVSIRLLGPRQERGYAVIRRAEPNEWREEAYWVPEAVMEFDAFPEGHPFWMDYIAKKQAFVDLVAAEELDTEPDKRRASRAIQQRNVAVKLLYRRAGMTQGSIADALGLSQPVISEVLKGQVDDTTPVE